MSENLGNIYYTVSADVTDLESAHRRIDDSIGRTESQLNRIAKAISGVIASGALVKFLTDAAKAAMDFNASISNLSAITGAVGKDLQFLRDTALEFGATTTLSASQAAEALKLVASAKPDLLQSGAALKEVTRQTVLLAEAAGIDLAQAASTVGKSLNQFGADASEAARFVNVLAAGSKFGSAEIPAISEALKAAGVAAASAKVSFEETGAAIQVLAAVGLQGSEAGTALRNVFLKLDNDVNKNLRPSVVGLSQALRNVNALNESGAEQVKRFGLENIVAAQTLIASADGLDILTKRLTGTSTAIDQAKTNTDNLAGDMKALGSVVEALQIKVGSLADGEMRLLAKTFTDLLSAINGNGEALKNWGGLLNGVATAGEALAVVLAGRLITSTMSYAAATIAKTAAVVADVKAEDAAAAASLRRAAAEKSAALSTLSSMKLDLQAAINTNAYAFAKANLTKQSSLAAVAVGNYNKAVVLANAANAKAIASTTALGLAMRGANGIMALLGGPAGLAIIAASAIAYYYATAETAAEKTKALADSVDALAQSYTGLNEQQRSVALSKVNTEMDATRQKLISATNALNNWTENAKKDPFANQQVKRYKNEVESLTEKLNELSAEQQAIFKSGMPPILNTTPEVIASTGNAISDSVAVIDSSLADLRAKLTLTAEGYEEYALRKQLAASGASEAVIQSNLKELRSLQDLQKQNDLMEQVDADTQTQKLKVQTDYEQTGKAITADLETPAQKAERELAERLEVIRLYNGLETQEQAAQTAIGLEAHKAYSKQMAEIDKDIADKKQQTNMQTLGHVGDFFGNMAEIAKAGGKKQFAIYKIAASAQAGISAAMAIMSVLADQTVPFWLKPAAVGTMAALAGVQIAQINSQSYGGGKLYGGSVQSGTMYPVNENGAPELFQSGNKQYLMPNSKGEVISNKDATSSGGGGSMVTVNVINQSSNTSVTEKRSMSSDRGEIIDIIVSDINARGKTHRAITNNTTAGNKL